MRPFKNGDFVIIIYQPGSKFNIYKGCYAEIIECIRNTEKASIRIDIRVSNNVLVIPLNCLVHNVQVQVQV